MAWSTPVVAPPDGSMGDYMASLQKLAKRTEPVYFPGHGGAVNNAPRFVAAYILHRKAREASILNRLQKRRERHPDDGHARSTPTSIRGCSRPPACRCWRIWRIWWRAARSRPTARPRSPGAIGCRMALTR